MMLRRVRMTIGGTKLNHALRTKCWQGPRTCVSSLGEWRLSWMPFRLSSSSIIPSAVTTRRELLAALPSIYPYHLSWDIKRDELATRRFLVVLDDDPTGTQTVHSIPVLADWSVDILKKEFESPGQYRVVYLNTNSRALPARDAFAQYEQIARNLKQACIDTGTEVALVSRGDSTLRGHFPGDLLALEKGMGVEYDAWILAPFFEAGGRFTVGDVHFVEHAGKGGNGPRGAADADADADADSRLIPAGETEFARDAAFGYRSSNLVEWIKEKSAGVGSKRVSEATRRITSISLQDIRQGGPGAVRARLVEAHGGCLVVNAVERRDLEVFVKGLLEEELKGHRYLFRTAADFVAVRGAVEPRPLLERQDFETLRARFPAKASQGGLSVVGSYVAKTTEQLNHALATTDAVGVELQASELIGEGSNGRAAFDREVERGRARVSLELSRGRDVILYTSRGAPLQADGARGLIFGERVGAAVVACMAGIDERPRFLLSKGGITSSEVATGALNMTRAEVMGQILPGVPVWSMPEGSRWPGLPLVVFPGNVGGKEAVVEAMLKVWRNCPIVRQSIGLAALKQATNGTGPTGTFVRVLGARPRRGGGGAAVAAAGDQIRTSAATWDHDTKMARAEALYPYASGSGYGNRTLDVLAEAKGRGVAVGAFTVYSLEGIRAVVDAAEATGTSAILQAHPAALGFQRGVPLLSAAVSAARACTAAGGPLLSVQLDHGFKDEHVAAALEAGVDSVMVDGSMMDYERNVAWTAQMAEVAHKAGVAVEAELGRLAGEEDGMSVSEVEARMTDPNQVPDFLARTKADILAVTVGNVHGRYANPDPRLDLPRLERIANVVKHVINEDEGGHGPLLRGKVGTSGSRPGQSVLLAMHGASGLPRSQVQGSIQLGVCKFNVNTEVRSAAVEYLLNSGAGIGKKLDLLGLLDGSVAAMRAVIQDKMREFDPS